MDFFAQQIINGLNLGLIYALVAIGFSLFFGVLNLVNFAHGDIAIFGAFLGLTTYTLFKSTGILSPVIVITVTLLVSIVGTSLLGLLTERVVIRKLRLNKAPDEVVLLGTVGISIIISEAIRLFYPQGSSAQPFPILLSNRAVVIGDSTITSASLLIWALTLIIIYIMYFIINRTRFGMNLRAVAQDRDMAAMVGISISRTIILTFIIGSALAAVAGYFNALYYQTVRFNLGLPLAIKGFSAAVVGGLGNVYGSIIGALLIGFAEMFGSAFIPGGSQNQDVITFLIIMGFLIFRPSGIIGEKVSEKV